MLEKLEDIFPKRVLTAPDQLLLYSHDVGILPSFMRKLLMMKPDAVVQPVSVEELISLLQLANEYKIPLVPRGAGTSGFGGSIPVKGGIVVDFLRMNRILEIDQDAQEVTVEPGVVWWDLEKEINRSNLSLRCYPSSALSATVGGWIAQGGCGIGSFRYGGIEKQVEWADVLLPEGKIKRFFGSDLPLVIGCEGITGFIIKARIKVKEKEEIFPFLFSFQTLEELIETISKLPEDVWSVSFQSPELVRLRKELKVALKESWTGLFVSTREEIKTVNGEQASEEDAWREWEERFYPLRIKKLGPSIIPGEVVLPLERVENFLYSIKANIPSAVVHGVMANRRECSLLLLWLDDETRVDYPVAWGNPVRAVDFAKRHGGRSYSSGLYLSSEAERIFGQELRRIKRYKREVDPSGIMNPGKIFSPRIRFFPLKLSTLFTITKPLMKLDLDIFRYRRPEGKELYRLSKNVLSIGIDEEDAWDIYSCANCGYCSACPIFKQFFLEEMLPRGKSFYFKRYFEGESQLNEKISGWIFLCTTCGRCEQVCQTEIPWVKLCEKIRASLQNFILPAHERIGKFSEEFHNPYGEKEHGFAKRKGGKIAYFAGCTSLYRMKNLAENSARILDSLGLAWITLGEDEWCCGSPLLRTGQMALAEKLILHNIESLNRLGAKKLITQCAGCYMTISTSWQEIAKKNGVRMGFRPMHLSVFLTREIENVEFSSIQKKITYHDPCHLGRRCKIYDEPRKILESIPGIKLVEMEAARENSECCGAGGGVRSAFPDVADLLAKKRVEQGMKTGAESIVSSCPFCELSFRLVSKVEVLDVVDLVSLALK